MRTNFENMNAGASPLLAARITPAGRGAVATIRVSLPPANMGRAAVPRDVAAVCESTSGPIVPSHFDPLNRLFQAANGKPLSEQPLQKIVFGRWGTADFEDLVICKTNVETLEIHCHGGEAAVARILEDLENAGCRTADWREQLLTIAGVFQRECAEILSLTSTWRTTRIVLAQTNGILTSSYEQLIRAIRVGTTLGRTQSSVAGEPGWRDQLDDLLQWSDFGLHLSTPWNVVLTGRPNVGKSSLINALLGYQRAIVFDEPGTTRDVVTGETAFEGWPVVLADTAGIREKAGLLEEAGIALARKRLAEANLRIVLIDVSQSPTEDDHRLLAEWPDALLVAHKSDRPNRWGSDLPSEAIPASSRTGDGIQQLQRRLVERLVPQIPSPSAAIPLTARQIELLKKIRSAQDEGERCTLAKELLA